MIEIMISSSVLIVSVALLLYLLRGRISPHLKYGMWGLVALRLAAPWFYPLQILISGWESRFSVMNAADAMHSRVIAGTALEPLADNVANGRVYHFDAGAAAGSQTAAVMQQAGIFQRAAGIDWQLWIFVIWGLGSLCILGYMLWVNLRFDRKLRRERRRYKGKVPVFVTRPVYVVEGLSSPCYVGFGQEEAIYLPDFIAENEEKTRHALAHETGHAMHFDRLWGIVRCGLLCLYWVNPFVWLAAVLSRRDCELSCDETAVRLLGEEERYAYGRTLVDLIAVQGQRQALFSVATTMAAGKGTVRDRIQILTKHPRTTGAMCILMAAMSMALVACTFSGGTRADADSAGSADVSTLPSESTEDMESTEDTETADEFPEIGVGDELVLLKEEQYGNYYRLTLERRDAATGEALPVKVSYRPENDDRGLRVTAYADEAGTMPAAGMDMGFGYSQEPSGGHAFSVDFWNVQGAAYYRIELVEGENNHVAYQFATKDETPLEISTVMETVMGQNDTAATIRRIQVYSNAVWIVMTGRTAEEAQQFYHENVLALQLEGEGDYELHRPTVGGQDGAVINLLYQFEPDTFPGAALKAMVAGKGNVLYRVTTRLDMDNFRLREAVELFAEAYMSGDKDTASRYSTISEEEMDDIMQMAPGTGTQLSVYRDEKLPDSRAHASYRFTAEGDTDSYSYLTMEVEKLQGDWKVTFAGFEK